MPRGFRRDELLGACNREGLHERELLQRHWRESGWGGTPLADRSSAGKRRIDGREPVGSAPGQDIVGHRRSPGEPKTCRLAAAVVVFIVRHRGE